MFNIHLWEKRPNFVQTFDIGWHPSPQDRNLIWIDTEARHLSNTPKGACCHVRFFETPCTVAHQVSLSMEFFRKEYRRGLPFPSLGDLLHPGIEPRSPASWADSLPSEPPGKTKIFWARNKTSISCFSRWILYHWATKVHGENQMDQNSWEQGRRTSCSALAELWKAIFSAVPIFPPPLGITLLFHSVKQLTRQFHVHYIAYSFIKHIWSPHHVPGTVLCSGKEWGRWASPDMAFATSPHKGAPALSPPHWTGNSWPSRGYILFICGWPAPGRMTWSKNEGTKASSAVSQLSTVAVQVRHTKNVGYDKPCMQGELHHFQGLEQNKKYRTPCPRGKTKEPSEELNFFLFHGLIFS